MAHTTRATTRTLSTLSTLSLLLPLSLLLGAAQAQSNPNPPAPNPAAPSAVQAPAINVGGLLTLLARRQAVPADALAPALRTALPTIQGGFSSFEKALGAFQGVQAMGGNLYQLSYAGGAVNVEAAPNAQGQLGTLFIRGQTVNTPPAPADPLSSVTVKTVPEALQRLVIADVFQAAWFTPEFGPTISAIQGGFKGFGRSYGDFQGTDSLGNDLYRLRYAGGTVTVQASINAQGQIDKLFLKSQQENATAPSSPSAPNVTDALQRFLNAGTLSSEWFSPELLQTTPLTQLQSLSTSIHAQLGRFQSLRTNAEGTYTAQFSGGTLPIKSAALDAQGRFAGLYVGLPASTTPLSLSSALSALARFGDKRSAVIFTNGKQISGMNPESKLAVGSAFKLGVLAELYGQIKAGKRHWNDTATLQEADKSLPSGTLQSWPTGSALTLQSLATLMIAQSDNTAADVLLRVVGRAGVAQRLGLSASTLLSTREAFALKNPANKALLPEYLQGGNVPAQAATAPLPAPSTFAGQVVAPQVEWFVSAATLCKLMDAVAPLPLTQINPGVADPAQYKTVSFKGGSEGGVLNLTTQVTTKKGNKVCVSATFNSAAPLDEESIMFAYAQLLRAASQ